VLTKEVLVTMKEWKRGNFIWVLGPIFLALSTYGCAGIDHTHPDLAVDKGAVEAATTRAEAAASKAESAASRANASAGKAEAAASKAEAAARRAEAAALKAERAASSLQRKDALLSFLFICSLLYRHQKVGVAEVMPSTPMTLVDRNFYYCKENLHKICS
jgi:hypothetical protein